MISAASVVVEDGVVLTHAAEDADGLTITTMGDFTISATASLNVTGKGCPSSQSLNESNVCSDNGTAAGTGEGEDMQQTDLVDVLKMKQRDTL